MTTNSQETSSPFMGVVLFFLWGLALISLEIPVAWRFYPWIPGIFLVSTIFILPIGMCIGWIKSFPRWSYPYVGHVLVFCLYMTNVATPGFLFGKEPWGWRAWLPFLIIASVALIVTRSLKPIAKFFTNVWNDWTLLTFGMFGFMPLLVAIAFDEMDLLYSLYFMVLVTLLTCGAAFFYMRSNTPRQKFIALLSGIVLTTAVAIIGPTLYWLGSGGVNPRGMIIMGGIVVVFMFSPALIEILPRLIVHATTYRT